MPSSSSSKPSEFAVLDPQPGDHGSCRPGAKVHVNLMPVVASTDCAQTRRRSSPRRLRTARRTPSRGTSRLGAAGLPIPTPQCMELGQLIEQLEEMPAPIASGASPAMLVDAGARDFTWVDPTPSKIIETPPAISFTVSTAKFEAG